MDHGLDVVTIETSDLGDRSYVVTDGRVAAVVDPQRDVDRVFEAVAAKGVEIALVVETHIHNDYVSGGLELSRRAGARYAVAAGEHVDFPRVAVSPGDRLRVGRLELEVVSTPGHTSQHVSYTAWVDAVPAAAFTGGSMLYGAVGRTDLLGDDLAENLARAQFQSAHRLAAVLEDSTEVYPTHGFGSFCSSSREVEVGSASLADERGRNPALLTDNEDEFVRTLLAGYTAYPSYYRHMAPLNRRGPAPVDLAPPRPLTDDEISDRLARGAWVVDLRDRHSYARAHRRGTVNVEAGRFFATYLGWTLPFDPGVTLLGPDGDSVTGALRSLARIGFDHVDGAATGDAVARGDLSGYRIADFAELVRVSGQDGEVVLDVRRDDEWGAGHIEGAHHVHLGDLVEAIDDVPSGRVWVHCKSGFRAAIAASLLDRAGREVVLVDDEWDRAAVAGLPVVHEAAVAA